MSVPKSALEIVDAEEDRLRARASKILEQVYRECSPEFAVRVEQHLREQDMLPRPKKQN